MSTTFDQHAINHATFAVRSEMTPRGQKRHEECDVLFIGGISPTEADLTGLAEFGLRKNYNVILASFDPADMGTGPVAFHAVVTDGETAATVLEDGRLWKADRRSPAVLLFPGANVVLKMNAKGFVVRPMSGRYDDKGFDLARAAVAIATADAPGQVPVVSNLGGFAMVLDSRAMMEVLAAA